MIFPIKTSQRSNVQISIAEDLVKNKQGPICDFFTLNFLATLFTCFLVLLGPFFRVIEGAYHSERSRESNTAGRNRTVDPFSRPNERT